MIFMVVTKGNGSVPQFDRGIPGTSGNLGSFLRMPGTSNGHFVMALEGLDMPSSGPIPKPKASVTVP